MKKSMGLKESRCMEETARRQEEGDSKNEKAAHNSKQAKANDFFVNKVCPRLGQSCTIKFDEFCKEKVTRMSRKEARWSPLLQ